MSAGVSYAGMAFNFEIMKNLFCLCILLLIGSMPVSYTHLTLPTTLGV